MEKTRVARGQKYYYVNHAMNVSVIRDERGPLDKEIFESGNYFHTEKEAEVMAHKLRAVLNGADVIEIPNGEEITEKIFSTAGEIVGRDREITVSDCMKTAKVVAEWLKKTRL